MFCKNCGAENRNDSKFCMQCGAKLDDYTKPKQNLLMPDDVKIQNEIDRNKIIAKVLYYVGLLFLLAGLVFIFCSLFFLKIPFIIVSIVCFVAMVGLSIANLCINKRVKKLKNPIAKSKEQKADKAEKLAEQTLPPQDDQINYKR